MAESEEAGFLQSGREIGVQEIEHIREVSRGFPALSRKELAQTICEHWGWVTARRGTLPEEGATGEDGTE